MQGTYNPAIVKYTILLLWTLFSFNIVAQDNPGFDYAELNKTLQNEFANDFNFSVLIERNDSIEYFENYGYLDKDKLQPVNDQTLFNIASITKSITATAIMMLVEDGEIKLSDTLDLFFENVPTSKQSISIKTLLSHKSGLRQTYPLENISDSESALKKILKQKLEFTPKSKFRYSNQNYQLLALIIEKVTRIPYEEFIKKNILMPLKMQNTYFWDEADPQSNMALADEDIMGSIGKKNWGYIGSGGIFTTSKDLLKFWNGFYKNDLLSAETIDIMFKSYYETKSGIQIGLGFFKTLINKWDIPFLWTRGTESWGHNGSIQYFPDKNITIIVTTNSGEIGNDSSKTGNRIISDIIGDYLFK